MIFKSTFPIELEVSSMMAQVAILNVGLGLDEVHPDTPCLDGNIWTVKIDLNSGCIQGWSGNEELAITARTNGKGCFYLMDEDDNIMALREDSFCPAMLSTSNRDEYMDLIVLPTGRIRHWPRTLDLSPFQPAERLVEKLSLRLAAVTAERDEMIQKAINNRFPAYQEMGNKLSAAMNRIDQLENALRRAGSEV